MVLGQLPEWACTQSAWVNRDELHKALELLLQEEFVVVLTFSEIIASRCGSWCILNVCSSFPPSQQESLVSQANKGGRKLA
jgi:hypothetical protein